MVEVVKGLDGRMCKNVAQGRLWGFGLRVKGLDGRMCKNVAQGCADCICDEAMLSRAFALRSLPLLI